MTAGAADELLGTTSELEELSTTASLLLDSTELLLTTGDALELDSTGSSELELDSALVHLFPFYKSPY